MNSSKIYDAFESIMNLRKEEKNNSLIFSEHSPVKQKVDYCLSRLKDDFKEIIVKDFLENSYKYWWLESYSETNYYRKRFRAITAFVNLFNLIYENNIIFSNINSNCY